MSQKGGGEWDCSCGFLQLCTLTTLPCAASRDFRLCMPVLCSSGAVTRRAGERGRSICLCLHRETQSHAVNLLVMNTAQQRLLLRSALPSWSH